MNICEPGKFYVLSKTDTVQYQANYKNLSDKHFLEEFFDIL